MSVVVANVSRGYATTLTFDIDGAGDGQAIPNEYGDNVNAANVGAYRYGDSRGFTPNLIVDYAANNRSSLRISGYGDLTKVLFDDSDGTSLFNLSLFINGESGWLAALHSFDLAAFTTAFGQDPVINSIRVFGPGGSIPSFVQENVTVSRLGHTTITLPSAVINDALSIVIDARNLGRDVSRIGIDNIVISQQRVPEPNGYGSILLTVAGLLSRRRHQ